MLVSSKIVPIGYEKELLVSIFNLLQEISARRQLLLFSSRLAVNVLRLIRFRSKVIVCDSAEKILSVVKCFKTSSADQNADEGLIILAVIAQGR